MADVQKSAFSLSSATIMLGRAFTDDVFALTPAANSVGMVSDVSVSVDSSINELLNGVAQVTVDAKRTNVATSITASVYEMTAQNFMRAHALSGAATQVKRGLLAVAVAAGSATTSISITSDPIPGETASAIAGIGDIPAGSTILIAGLASTGLSDYVFPTVSTGAATGTGPYVIPLAAPYAVPSAMAFAACSRVWIVSPLSIGDINADDLFCVKVTGTLSNYERPVTYVAPKVRMVKGFGISYDESQYSSMSWEMKPLLLSTGENASLSRPDFGVRRTGLAYAGG